jgi:hypothetical protein
MKSDYDMYYNPLLFYNPNWKAWILRDNLKISIAFRFAISEKFYPDLFIETYYYTTTIVVIHENPLWKIRHESFLAIKKIVFN